MKTSESVKNKNLRDYAIEKCERQSSVKSTIVFSKKDLSFLEKFQFSHFEKTWKEIAVFKSVKPNKTRKIRSNSKHQMRDYGYGFTEYYETELVVKINGKRETIGLNFFNSEIE